MALNRIILWLGNSLAIIAFLMALTSVFGLVLLEFVHSLNFAVLSVMTGLIGTILVLTTRNIPVKETKSDALAFLLVFWFVIPFVLAVPYLATNVTNQLSVAYFEAVSAFTTTGASSLNPDELPRTMHIWRSLLQWLGGVVVATFAVVILAVLNLRGTGIHRSLLFTFKKGELFSRLSGVGRVIASIYGGISAVCFVGLVMTGTPPFEAICLALTSVSTGGLTPNGDVLKQLCQSDRTDGLIIGLFAGGIQRIYFVGFDPYSALAYGRRSRAQCGAPDPARHYQPACRNRICLYRRHACLDDCARGDIFRHIDRV